MTEEELETAFEMMGTLLKGSGDNKNAKCPLAPWLHKKGVDKHPSLTAKAGSPALFRCWSCQSEGSVKKLARLYYDHSGDRQAYDYVLQVEGEQCNMWRKIEKPYGSNLQGVGRRIAMEMGRVPTEKDLERFKKLVPNYAVERGLTAKSIDRWEIGFDEKTRRMIVPIRERGGKLVGFSGRDVTGQQEPKWKHFGGFRKEKYLYGENFQDNSVRRAYIVEGFIDVIMLSQMGCRNCFASMGTSLSLDQMKKLSFWVQEIVFVPDCDDEGAGMRFCEETCEKLSVSFKLRAGIVGVEPNDRFVKRYRPRQWEPIDYQLKPIPLMVGKDPANLTRQEVATAIKHVAWWSTGGFRC